jgi:hypothetical protein
VDLFLFWFLPLALLILLLQRGRIFKRDVQRMVHCWRLGCDSNTGFVQDVPERPGWHLSLAGCNVPLEQGLYLVECAFQLVVHGVARLNTTLSEPVNL